MACPFFMPGERFVGIGWQHRARLPLGDGWQGRCTAPGHENIAPDPHELTEFCNLGYAKACPRLPQKRAWDAIRLCVTRDRENMIAVMYVCEANHHPREHGVLEYDSVLDKWVSTHRDVRIQKMVECYVQSYLSRRDDPARIREAQSTKSHD